MCVSPITINFKGDTRRVREACGLPTSILVPCGKCSECQKKKATSWGVRAYREFLFAPANSVRFVTITYDEDNVPYTPLGNKTLDSAQCKQFLKSLRQSLFRKFGIAIRFMCSGEYGSRTFRPHYHFLFYGIPPALTNVEFREIVRSAWHRCSVIDVQYPKNADSSGFYVGKYMAKSGYARAREIHYDDPDFVMPFKRSSIGFGNQFSRAEIAYYLAEDVSDTPTGYVSPSMDEVTYTIGDLFYDDVHSPALNVSSDVEFTAAAKKKLPFPSSAVTPAMAKKMHDDPWTEAQRWLDLFSRSPRFMEIVRRYHQCHRPLKDGSYRNIDFPEYLAIKLYGKNLYGDIKRCIAFAYARKVELDCDPASALLDPTSFAAKNYHNWIQYNRSSEHKLDFQDFLFYEHDRLNRQSSLILRRSCETENMRQMHANDVF